MIFREGLRTVIDHDDGLRVVGHSARTLAEDLADTIAGTRPDVVLLGLEQLGAWAEELVLDVLAALPDADVIVLGREVADDGTLERLLAAGLRAYVPKDVPHRYLLSVIHVSGFDDARVALSWPRPVWARRGEPSEPAAPPQDAQRELSALSTREREVVELVGQAMTNAQIGRRLGISEGTVKRHLHNIFVKLRAVSRLDAVNKAVSLSLIILQ
ncbi:response regulator transcription factor [Actinokineospora sp. NBRC 105648]|uniref:response regulator transcription factor n=1 Tax=Actinokineospora sp. NBRC 105648 TaxID=3032206 RepID=UPI002555999F|nr:response regulator transcription factor [Actinokineospora sp. NBRC 105648]